MDIDIPPGWERSAETIAARGLRKVLVLGAVDSGKSTYCSFLGRRLANAGFDAALVDADVGQKDVGPPACITQGLFDPSTGARPNKAVSFYFVGAVSPARHLLPMVIGTSRLVYASRASFVIINTTGLIHGVGRILKGYKIESVRPDAIVAIRKGHELESILHSYRNHNIMRIARSELSMAKPVEARKEARESAFARYFENGSELSMDLSRLIFQRCLLFSGKPAASAAPFLHFEKTAEGIVAVGAEPDNHDPDMHILQPGFEENLLCGVADGRNRGVGLAIIKRIDFPARKILLVTPAPPFHIRILQPGDLYITEDGRELDRKRPGHL